MKYFIFHDIILRSSKGFSKNTIRIPIKIKGFSKDKSQALIIVNDIIKVIDSNLIYSY